MQQDQKINQFRCPLKNKLYIQSSFLESGVISGKECVSLTNTVLLRGGSLQLHPRYVTVERIRLTFSMKQRANKIFASSSSKFPLFEYSLSSWTPMIFLTPTGWPKRRHLIFFFKESTWPVWYVCSCILASSSNDCSSWTYGTIQRQRKGLRFLTRNQGLHEIQRS